jgi:Tectonin domain
VWALDPLADVWQFVKVGVVSNVLVHGPLAQIQAGGNGVWGINSSEEVFRVEQSQMFKVQIPGAALVSISVGSGGGVWGINNVGQPLAFITP